MFDASVRLTIFLRALYLRETGIPSDTLEAVLDGMSGEAQHLRQLN
jgi:hypothetical protein